jgi:hypothetical protein
MFFVDPLFFSDGWDEVEPDGETRDVCRTKAPAGPMQAWLGCRLDAVVKPCGVGAGIVICRCPITP